MSVRTDILKSSEVLDKIKQLLDQSEQLDIAVAYLKRTGLNLLKPEIPECGTQKVCDKCGFDQFTVGVGIWYPDADIDSDTFDSLIAVKRCFRCWNTSTESFP